MKIKISFALISLACIVLITLAIYLGSFTSTQIFVTSAAVFVAMLGGFYLLEENDDQNDSTDDPCV